MTKFEKLEAKVKMLEKEQQEKLQIDRVLAWHCVAHHLDVYNEDFKYKRIAGSTIPCETCKYNKICDSYPALNFTVLTEKTGVTISPMVEKGSKDKKQLKNRITDLEKQIQDQQKEFCKALAFLFDRSGYKELIKQKKLEWPKMLTKAIDEYFDS